MSKQKKTASVRKLEKRMEEACEILTGLAIIPDRLLSYDYYLVDQAVRVLQGKNYEKYVADVEASAEKEEVIHWHTGDERWRNH